MTFYFFSFYCFSIRHRAYFILRHCLRPYYWIGLDTVSHDELDHDLSRNFSISLSLSVVIYRIYRNTSCRDIASSAEILIAREIYRYIERAD